MYEPSEDTVDAPPRKSSFPALPVLLVVGWIIYEVTHQPAVAAMAMCMKFGWEDFRTARWLLRTDPSRSRGRTCAWLYIASGLWQAAVIGLAMVLLSVALDQVIQANRQGPGAAVELDKLLSGAAFTILFGFTFSTVATYIALLYAWRHDVRPWLNGAVHIARRNNEWPPLYGHTNRVLVPVISTVVMTCFILLPACLAILGMILHGAIPRHFLRGLVLLGSVFSVIILLPILVVILQNLRRQRFFAEHPADCWGQEPLPKPFSFEEDDLR